MSTYTPIATQTLGSATPSVTFSSLPQNYADFIVVANYGISANLYGLRIRFNDDTGSNYSDTVLYGNGSSATSARDTSATSIVTSAVGVTNNVLNYNFICSVQNYSNSSTNKTVLVRGNATDREAVACVGLWRNTNSVNSITIFVGSGNILSGSTFTIYGIAAGNSSAKATGGNIVTTDGSYWYHAFTSSGTFVPSRALTVDYLVVAGGGGGGWTSNNYAGGGGAGGLRSTVTATGGGGSLESPLYFTANPIYKAIIGAGGSVGGAYQTGYTRGFDSTFATITSVGGGNAALSSSSVGSSSNGSSGGSGGGGTGNSGAGGSASPSGQGFAGGSSGSSSNGGGGGGAGEAGNTDGTGAGGDGVQITALATATGTGFDSGYYAGGGGGAGASPGSGGLGGGGAGKSSGAGNPGLVNSGGGGGGTNGAIPGNGGSGIIIVRYAV